LVYGYYTCDFVIANCNIFNDFCSLSNLAILLDFGLNCLSEECSAYNRVWLPFDRYDAVTYLKYLDTLRVSESFRSVWIFAEASYKIFDYAKKRVFHLVRADGVKFNESSKSVKNKKRRTKGDDKDIEEGERLLLCFV